MVFEAAELYFFHGRAAEAIAICNQVLQLDPRNAEAAALLGDIFAEQGRREGAIAMYERAVRSQPDNALYRQKWEALRAGAPGTPAYAPYAAASAHRAGNGAAAGSATGAATGNIHGNAGKSGAGVRVGTGRGGYGANGPNTNGAPSATAASAATASRPAASRPAASRPAAPAHDYNGAGALPNAPSRRAISLGYSLLFGAAVFVAWLLFSPPPELPAFYADRTIEEPSSLMLILVSLAAVLSGAGLALSGMIDGVQHMRTRGTMLVRLMFIVGLVLLGLAAFPFSILFYFVFSLISRSWNKPLLVILMASLFLASTLALPFPDDNLPVLKQALLFWSGRTILPAMLGGWFIGSIGRVKL
jgi:hypothetical protein